VLGFAFGRLFWAIKKIVSLYARTHACVTTSADPLRKFRPARAFFWRSRPGGISLCVKWRGTK
jgi:hypothetical protein